MNNADMPAMPNMKRVQLGNGATRTVYEGGLTKLEYFAGLAMQGLLATTDPQTSAATDKEVAMMAVGTAKALLAELEQEKSK